MKKLVLSLVALLCLNLTLVGQSEPEIDYAGELVKSVEVPQSPEAAAFEKYGNVGVSMYTGTPNISVPIYTIKGREMDLPISLSYDASGVKVEQLASQVGLSWSLNVGGRISRVVNGLPDNYSFGDYATIFKTAAGYTAQNVIDKIKDYASISTDFSTLAEGQNYITFLDDISKNNVDTEPDYYSLNAPGLSDHIIFDLNTSPLAPKTLKNPRINVVHGFAGNGTIDQWVITNEDGTKYYFEAHEITRAEGNDALPVGGIIKEYNSSWVLTKIESSNKKDVYEFTYNNNVNNTPFNFWTQPAQIGAASVTNTDNIVPGTTNFPGPDTQVLFSPEYQIKQLYLTQIKHNTRVIADFELGEREDIDKNINSALKSIKIYDFNGNILKKYDLHHGYFGVTTPSQATSKLVHEIRLKLDSIQIKGSGGTNRFASYKFEYFSPASVPNTQSTSQDYLGYYNGKSNGSNLYPQVIIGNWNFWGANRDIDFNKAKIGTLNKIIYPTGGSTTFNYESHEVSQSINTMTDVQYEFASLSGGNGPSSCGICCQDKFVTDPNVSYKVFEITESGNYDISLTRTGNPNGEAYILNRPNNTSINYSNATNTTTCTANDALWQSMNGQPEETTRYFAAGYYQITLVNKTPSSTIAVRVHRLESQTNTNVDKAGLRIASTVDNPGMGQSLVTKNYKYVTDITNTTNPESSGKIIYDPKLYYFTTNTVQENGLPVEKSTINRVAQAAGGNQPHVAYSKVYEIEQNNGYIEHNFNTGLDGIVTRPGPPFSNRFVSDFKAGKENLTKVFSEVDDIVTYESTEYINDFLHSSVGFSINSNASRTYKYVAFEQVGSIYRLTYVDALITPQAVTLPALCSNSNFTCLSNPELAALDPFNTIASGYAGNVLKRISSKYYGNDIVTSTVDYTYNANHLLQETKTTGSDNIEVKTKNYYPSDFSGITVYGDMVNENRLNTVVKTESYYNTVKTGTQETAYKKWGTNNYLPQFLKASKDNITPEQRLTYHSYYTNGNVREVSLKNSPKTVYIWGYDDTFPIAKIENATYAQVSSQVTNLKNKSNLDDDRTTGTLGKEGALRAALTTLRNSLPNAMVTTYTYDPLIGVTSITDPSGQIIYYDYDEFNRLKEVKNKNGELLSSNNYHFKN